MIDFPSAKINLGLYITEKRPDGFHNIATLFYPVGIKDSLEIIPDLATEQESTWRAGLSRSLREKINSSAEVLSTTLLPDYIDEYKVRYSESGLAIAGPTIHNLCIRAYGALKKDFPDLPAIQMHLHKNIPSGAGLGGGSADGAFTLKMLNQLFDLNLSTKQLMDYAAGLGSDCPFFILNQPALGTGRGELLEPFLLDLSGYYLVLIHPGIHIPTAAAFAGIQPAPMKEPNALQTLLQRPPDKWRGQLENVFEGPIFKQYPEIAAIKQTLYEKGALYASMSGSGSTVYGLFKSAVQEESLGLPPNYLFYGCRPERPTRLAT